MINITNIDSNAIETINVDDTTSVVGITYKSSGKEYNYTLNGITAEEFVNTLQNVIETDQSVGRFVNKAIREDQTLQIMAV
jgi:hypothetical protein